MKRAVFTILLFPIIVFLGLVGLSLLSVGSHQSKPKRMDIARIHSVKIRPGIYLEFMPHSIKRFESQKGTTFSQKEEAAATPVTAVH